MHIFTEHVVDMIFIYQQGEYECKTPTTGAGLQGVCSLCSPQRRGPAQSRTPEITPNCGCNKVGGLCVQLIKT